MYNINSYKEFINEGFLSFFGKKQEKKPLSGSSAPSETFLKLMKIINEIDPRLISRANNNSYSFTIRFHNPSEDDQQDPHGEEIHDDDVTIYINQYDIFINGDQLPLLKSGNMEFYSLRGAIERKYKTQKDYERDMRIKNALDKL